METSLGQPQPPSGRYDLRILQAIRRIIRSTEQRSREIAEINGVSVSQLLCLSHLVESPQAMTVKELAAAVYLTPSTVVGILNRLEGRGLALRSRKSEDRRVVTVKATDAGQRLVERAPSPLQQELAEALEALDPDEQNHLADSFDRIVEVLDIEQVDAAPILETGAVVDPVVTRDD